MKDYSIWLKSSESINGTAKEDILKMLQDRFKDHEDGKEVISFQDTDGTVILDLNRIEAITVIECHEDKEAGFKS